MGYRLIYSAIKIGESAFASGQLCPTLYTGWAKKKEHGEKIYEKFIFKAILTKLVKIINKCLINMSRKFQKDIQT